MRPPVCSPIPYPVSSQASCIRDVLQRLGTSSIAKSAPGPVILLKFASFVVFFFSSLFSLFLSPRFSFDGGDGACALPGRHQRSPSATSRKIHKRASAEAQITKVEFLLAQLLLELQITDTIRRVELRATIEDREGARRAILRRLKLPPTGRL